ncbi:calcium-binding protein [Algicella marina]|uniref:Calcium-binding protein n=1 Tax=Algicella marina TaxID=2683284 RepID=A0A6P1SZK0_9RHOB|nr:hypothetical protein [Algicella marina]QHQ34636.1 hypothetical protein GO499_05235 [Algicella marina]
MPAIQISGPYNLGDILADIENTTPDDILFAFTDFVAFTMDDGRTGTLSVLTIDGESTTTLSVENAGATLTSFTLEGDFFSPTGNFGISDYLATTPLPATYGSEMPGAAVFSVTPGADIMAGLGRFRGGAGNDMIGLVDPLDNNDGSRSIAFGNNGHDTLFSAVDRATLNGGNGNDRLEVGMGSARMIGGAGADDFFFSSWQINGTDGRDLAYAFITDFEVGTDGLYFTQFTGGGNSAESIADRFGENVFFEENNPTAFDGVRIDFREAADGDAIISRRGVDAAGNFIRDVARFDGLGLDDLDPHDIYIFEGRSFDIL